VTGLRIGGSGDQYLAWAPARQHHIIGVRPSTDRAIGKLAEGRVELLPTLLRCRVLARFDPYRTGSNIRAPRAIRKGEHRGGFCSLTKVLNLDTRQLRVHRRGNGIRSSQRIARILGDFERLGLKLNRGLR